MRNELQKHKKLDAIKWIVVFVAIAVLTVSVAAALTKGFTDSNPFGWFDKQTEQTPAAPDTGGGVTDENGNPLISGEVYNMPSNMVFSSASATSESANGGVMIRAIITPDTATDKSLDWSVAWVNSSSDFARGKSVADYLSVVPTTEYATTATVSCLKAFGEKIQITVTSIENPNATATCTVDFSEKVTNATLKFGNLNINLGGDTDIKWEINPNGDGVGGAVTPTYTKNSVYTLSDSFIVKVELFNDGNRGLILDNKPVVYNRATTPIDITTDTINFNHSLFTKWDRMYVSEPEGRFYFDEYNVLYLLDYFGYVTNGYIWSVRITVKGTYSTYVATSRIFDIGFTNQALVKSVAFENSTLIM